jgi:hypothetical protein
VTLLHRRSAKRLERLAATHSTHFRLQANRQLLSLRQVRVVGMPAWR